MSDPIILISKSHAEKRWSCERAEYYAYFWGDTGLQPTAIAWDLEFGKIIHDALAQIARTLGMPDPITTIALSVQDRVDKLCRSCAMDDSLSKQWAMIGEGLIRGFYKRRWPEIVRQYEILHVEAACVLPLGEGVWFVSIPDLILRDRHTGWILYWEYKTTGWTDARWLKSWQKKIQVHSGIRAARHTLQLPVEGCIIEGLWKGKRQQVYNSSDWYQNSVFAWGWKRDGVPGVVDDQFSYTSMRGKGWERFPTSGLIDGIGPWVEEMPLEILDAQYVRTPTISLNEDMADDFAEQTIWRVRELRQSQQDTTVVLASGQSVPQMTEQLRSILNRYFPQNFDACAPAFGHECEYQEICWSSSTRRDPTGSGFYKRRTLDHYQEFIKLLPVQQEKAA